MTKPLIFVGSSKSGLTVARAIQTGLSDVGIVRLWKDEVFKLSEHSVESLEHELDRADYGVFVLTPDDTGYVRGVKKMLPRDNVLFEAGLFAGRLGMDRTYIVHPNHGDLALPTDLLGISTARYDSGVTDAALLPSSLGPAVNRIRSRILETWQGGTASWHMMCDWVASLGAAIKRSPGMGGFSADALVGVSRGGLIVADLLSRHLGSRIPVLCLWADRRHTDHLFDGADNWPTRYVLTALGTPSVRNILVVDDIVRRGTTILEAVDLLRRTHPDKQIRSGALITDEATAMSPDYSVLTLDTTGYKMPFATVD